MKFTDKNKKTSTPPPLTTQSKKQQYMTASPLPIGDSGTIIALAPLLPLKMYIA
jgi:hypothetical protein